ncbi:MAG: antitoxin [Planctomycetes bacterium]|nr:antitoxin [Planctomycetota bacterium]
MRTTLSVEDDLLDQVRIRAAAQRLSVAEVLNRALRRGLAEDPAPRLAEPTLVYGDPSASASAPDDAALRARSAQLDDEELQRKLAR